jgi:hypothetical protein
MLANAPDGDGRRFVCAPPIHSTGSADQSRRPAVPSPCVRASIDPLLARLQCKP